MGLRQSGWVRMGFRRAGQSSGGGGGSITLVQGTAPINVAGGSGPTVTVSHNASGVVAGSYTYGSFTVNASGHVTAAGNGAAPVTAVSASAPLASSGGATPNLTHNASGVVAGSYTYGSFTVDSTGHVTAAGNGAAPVTAVSASAPLASSGGATPNLTHNASGLGASTVAYPVSITFDATGHPSAATPGNPPAMVKLVNNASFTNVASISVSLAGYTRLLLVIDWDASGGVPNDITFTGLAANQYNYCCIYGISPTSVGSVNGASVANIGQGNMSGAASTQGFATATIDCPAAPAKKTVVWDNGANFTNTTNIIGRQVRGFSADTANTATAMVITMSSAVNNGHYSVWGVL